MKLLKKIILIIVLLFFEYSMFKISFELGLASCVLISAILCIWIVLNKITTVLDHSKLVLSSEPFRDSSKSSKKVSYEGDKKSNDVDNLITGVDADIFKQFREKLNLIPISSISNSSDSQSPLDSFNDNDTQINDSPNLVKEAYQKNLSFIGPDNFAETLDELDQVKVTLSENLKNIEEKDDKVHKEKNQDGLENVRNNVDTEELAETELNKNVKNNFAENKTKLGAGDVALELLSRKHQALKEQTEKLDIKITKDFDDDIFADELIPIPGGESILEEEIFSDEDPFLPVSDTYNLEEDSFSSSLSKINSDEEKNFEGESLLKLATTACESGKMDEARASLKSYFKILKELGLQATPDVLQLAEKIELPIDSFKTNSESLKEEILKSDADEKEDPLLIEIPEQANYESVMEGIVKSLEEKEQFEEALPLLKDLLNYNRKRVNISAMDPLYDRIEQAHSSMKNDEELVAAYKEHLTIKQQLGDLEGELHLLDLISYYYANTSDQKASERYQAESRRIKESLEKKNQHGN